jgi:hypothetical protein
MDKQSVTWSDVEPERRDETIFWQRRNHSETNRRLSTLITSRCGLGMRTSFMVELVAILIGVFAAGIFAAHAIDAYHAQ